MSYECLERSWNEVGMQLESFEHEQNIPTAHKNGPESLECSWNAAGSFRTQLEYPGVDKEWRIIACESSDYRHIVHDDGFVWLMFVHERFSVSEQTLNSQNHGVHYMAVITRLTCNNSILLTRNSPDWQTYRDDTADDTVLCISGIVLGITGLRLWLACARAFTKET